MCASLRGEQFTFTLLDSLELVYSTEVCDFFYTPLYHHLAGAKASIFPTPDMHYFALCGCQSRQNLPISPVCLTSQTSSGEQRMMRV